ncbi:helix-turn-helix domain-containing protein [Pseudooceanicola sp. 200-1SW]|uniref:helix-turn-helix domain-containing protein n=1 Tax=Pseudooceanicola sp. 200-1SW TaxID=3425949 RepID=UPI003D7FAAA6
MQIDAKSRKSARFISGLQKKIQAAFLASGKTQQEVADAIGVDRSVVNRRLKGDANLTARSISEFAYALGKDIKIEFLDPQPVENANWTRPAMAGTRFTASFEAVASGTVAPQSEYVLERTGS